MKVKQDIMDRGIALIAVAIVKIIIASLLEPIDRGERWLEYLNYPVTSA